MDAAMNVAVPVVDGYTLLGRVDVGGTSEVWRAVEAASGRIVAVKTLLPRLAEDVEERRAFFDEAVIMAGLDHPGIVKGYAHGVCGNVWYNALEFVDGYAFSDFLRRKGHVAEADCLLIAESVASALDYAWRRHGIVHCDIKPENLMINKDGEVKIIDLGSVHRVGSSDDAQSSDCHVVGTPAYISPEQVANGGDLDCRSDIYSLGATLYHLATGRILFPDAKEDEAFLVHGQSDKQAPDPRDIVPELSLGFVRFLEAMLVKNREGRIKSWPLVFEYCREVENGGDGFDWGGEFVSSVRHPTEGMPSGRGTARDGAIGAVGTTKERTT